MIINRFFGCIKQSDHRMRFDKSQKIGNSLRSFQFLLIHYDKIIPVTRNIFMKPSAQCCGRRYIFCPVIIFQPFFFDSTWPEFIYQHPISVGL